MNLGHFEMDFQTLMTQFRCPVYPLSTPRGEKLTGAQAPHLGSLFRCLELEQANRSLGVQMSAQGGTGWSEQDEK